MKVFEDFMFRNFKFYKRICYNRLPMQDLSDMYDMLSAMYVMTEMYEKNNSLSKKNIIMQKNTKITLGIMREILDNKPEVSRGGFFKRIARVIK